MISTEDSIIRLIIALILGGLIGYERQAQSKSAGLRTHTLVCVGSCLCMIISINIAMDYYFTFGYNNSDPERIAAQVVSGVGFIGAGTILANQKDRSVRGLTTAAGLWAVSAIGSSSVQAISPLPVWRRPDFPGPDGLRPPRCPPGRALPQEVCHAPSHEEQYRPGPEIIDVHPRSSYAYQNVPFA